VFEALKSTDNGDVIVNIGNNGVCKAMLLARCSDMVVTVSAATAAATTAG
jgi:hypothetical protein